ncbi:MAG TPA: LysR substrate-binding domain-containing protein [Candidatus Sulfotelmatobacter sp.]|jgi:DNA-binding transcriptional LysR family regulator|nr:LysR substrate-binding domain-containing protein [Candidatus Sulfotelmatobacter sp.]
MTLEQLRIFVAVAERTHFTRAAEALGLTQSAVSSAVAALEARTAVKLFHRIGRRVELTTEGVAFLAEARQVLRAARHAEEALDDFAGLRRGHLTVMASQTTAGYWLPPLLYRFRQSYPGIRVDLSIGNTAQVAAAVAAGEAEFGFVEGAVEQPLLSSRPVADDRLVLVVGGEHVWAADLALGADEFRRLPWVLRESGSGTRAATEALLATRGLDLSHVSQSLELPSNEAVRAAVEAGAGASVLSMLVVGTAIKAGLLQAAACALPGRPFSLLWHRERLFSRAGQAFIETLPGA